MANYKNDKSLLQDEPLRTCQRHLRDLVAGDKDDPTEQTLEVLEQRIAAASRLLYAYHCEVYGHPPSADAVVASMQEFEHGLLQQAVEQMAALQSAVETCQAAAALAIKTLGLCCQFVQFRDAPVKAAS